jgi:hypothetical protein
MKIIKSKYLHAAAERSRPVWKAGTRNYKLVVDLKS